MGITRTYPVADSITDGWFQVVGSDKFSNVDEDPTSPNDFDYIKYDGFEPAILRFYGSPISGVPFLATARLRAHYGDDPKVYVKRLTLYDSDNQVVGYTAAFSLSGVYQTFEVPLIMNSPPVGGWNLRNRTFLHAQFQNSGVTGYSNARVSAFDFVVSGTSPVQDVTTLFIKGYLPATGLNQNVPLYIRGKDLASSGLDLFIKGHDSLDLFVRGYDLGSGNIPLYLSGHEFSSGAIDLYTKGFNAADSYMNLFLKTLDAFPASSSFDLYIWGSTQSGLQSTIPLYLHAKNVPDYMNLFIQGDGYFSSSGNMNLFIAGEYSTVSDSITLFLNNTGISSGVPLYIKGKGYARDEVTTRDNSGYLPIDGSMNLFINRINEVGTIPLFLKSDFATSGIDLFTQGAYFESGVVPLVIPMVLGSTNLTMPLYINGF